MSITIPANIVRKGVHKGDLCAMTQQDMSIFDDIYRHCPQQPPVVCATFPEKFYVDITPKQYIRYYVQHADQYPFLVMEPKHPFFATMQALFRCFFALCDTKRKLDQLLRVQSAPVWHVAYQFSDTQRPYEEEQFHMHIQGTREEVRAYVHDAVASTNIAADCCMKMFKEADPVLRITGEVIADASMKLMKAEREERFIEDVLVTEEGQQTERKRGIFTCVHRDEQSGKPVEIQYHQGARMQSL